MNDFHTDDRVWNVKPAKVDNGWGWRTAVYYRDTRRDGMPIWRLERYVCEPTDDSERARIAGEDTGLTHEPTAKNNGIALQISDILAPDEETLVRLTEPMDFVILFSPARGPGRQIVGAGQREEEGWRFLRRIGSVSKKQVDIVCRLASKFGLRVAEIPSMPRLPGKELPIE